MRKSNGTSNQSWWDSGVGYEVYIRSFSDHDGDGVGDLLGIVDRLDYLAWLGVDIIWVTPFYPSPMVDHGYDVADYIDIDPLFGNMADMQLLLDRAHQLGLRVLADLVPNHTSDTHPWFREAVTRPDGPFRDYFLWQDPGPNGSPPNNWLSHFGGPAWTLDHTSGQYYCHLFLPQQPDLNWRNPQVHQEFDAILGHWFERGLDGFRVDVAQGLYKDADFRDNPVRVPFDDAMTARDRFFCLEHRYDLAQPETLDVYRRWHAIARRYDALLVGETFVETAQELGRLIDGTGLDAGFWFGPMQLRWEAAEIKAMLQAPVEHVGRGIGWVLSSHDDSRPVTRFGGGRVGRQRSLALTTLMCGLPGLPFLYQGEELGLEDAKLFEMTVPDMDNPTDPNAPGREPSRTPIPWDHEGEGLGFSTSDRPWLPMSHRGYESVAAQMDRPGSHLSLVRELIALRHNLDIAAQTPVHWLDDNDIVGFWRDDYFFGLNAASETRHVRLGLGAKILFATSAQATVHGPEFHSASIDPNTAIVAHRHTQPGTS